MSTITKKAKRYHQTADGYPLETNPDYSKKTLKQLAFSITHQHDMALIAGMTAVHHATLCGKALAAAKDKVPHGEWMKWVEDNSQLSHSAVNGYMRIAANSQRVANSDSIRSALKLLSDEKTLERQREISETYVPYKGEPVTEAPAPAPEKPTRSSWVKQAEVIEAEVIEPDDAEHETLVVDECGVPEPGVALVYARTALDALNKIPAKDPSREKSISMISSWVGSVSPPPPAPSVIEKPTAADFDEKNFYEIILVMIPHLTKDEIISLSEILKTRWL